MLPPGPVTGRSPSSSTPTEEDAATQPPAPQPLEAVQPKEVVEATGAQVDKNSSEPEPEPRKVLDASDGDASLLELQKMLEIGGEGEGEGEATEEPLEDVEAEPAEPAEAETELVNWEAAEPPMEVHPDSEAAEDLEQDPQEPDTAEVPMEPIPVVPGHREYIFFVWFDPDPGKTSKFYG